MSSSHQESIEHGHSHPPPLQHNDVHPSIPPSSSSSPPQKYSLLSDICCQISSYLSHLLPETLDDPLLMSIKFTLICFLAIVLSEAAGNADLISSCFTGIVSCAPSVVLGWRHSLDQLLGGLLGTFIGYGFSFLYNAQTLSMSVSVALSVGVSVFFSYCCRFLSGIFSAAFSGLFVIIVQFGNGPNDTLITRFKALAIASFVAFVVNVVISAFTYRRTFLRRMGVVQRAVTQRGIGQVVSMNNVDEAVSAAQPIFALLSEFENELRFLDLELKRFHRSADLKTLAASLLDRVHSLRMLLHCEIELSITYIEYMHMKHSDSLCPVEEEEEMYMKRLYSFLQFLWRTAKTGVLDESEVKDPDVQMLLHEPAVVRTIHVLRQLFSVTPATPIVRVIPTPSRRSLNRDVSPFRLPKGAAEDSEVMQHPASSASGSSSVRTSPKSAAQFSVMRESPILKSSDISASSNGYASAFRRSSTSTSVSSSPMSLASAAPVAEVPPLPASSSSSSSS